MHISSGVTLGIESHSAMFNNDSMFWLHPNIVICVWCRLGGVTSSRVYSLGTHKPNHWYHGMGCHKLSHLLTFGVCEKNIEHHAACPEPCSTCSADIPATGRQYAVPAGKCPSTLCPCYTTYFAGCWTISPPLLY